ncbi:MAG: iron-sulfur cluster assembly accessory protein [Candidatus Pacearchaeota archaeon]
MNQKTEVKNKTKITKESLIADILAEHPERAHLLSEILMDFGIHCIGCGASNFETLEEGVLGHGFSENDLKKLVADLNKAINSKIEKKSGFKVKNFELKLTSNALKKVKDIIKNEGGEKNVLRVSVLAGGCSGYTYDLELIEQKNAPKSDLKLRQDDLEISVDKDSLEFLSGTKIDFIDTLKESGFKFINPNATKECGCGKSFS